MRAAAPKVGYILGPPEIGFEVFVEGLGLIEFGL